MLFPAHNIPHFLHQAHLDLGLKAQATSGQQTTVPEYDSWHVRGFTYLNADCARRRCWHCVWCQKTRRGVNKHMGLLHEGESLLFPYLPEVFVDTIAVSKLEQAALHKECIIILYIIPVLDCLPCLLTNPNIFQMIGGHLQAVHTDDFTKSLSWLRQPYAD